MILAPPPPVANAELPAGTVLRAGLGQAVVVPDLDIESYSEAGYVWNAATRKWDGQLGAPENKKGLPVCGSAAYWEHPTAEVLMMSYDMKDGRGKRFWRPGLPDPVDLFAYLLAGGPLEAHNVMFERQFWEEVAVKRMGWPPVMPWQWRCSAAKARAHALPGSLGMAGAVMGLAEQKDKAGDALITKFSKPRNPTKGDPRTRILCLWSPDYVQALAEYHRRGLDYSKLTPAQVLEDYEDTLRYAAYNQQDIVAEAELSTRLPDLEGEELQWWQVDQAVNRRGIQVDIPNLKNCQAIIGEMSAVYSAELLLLCGVDSPSKVKQLTAWLAARGVLMENMDDESVAAALERTDLTPECRRVLEIRGMCASASVKKVHAMINQASVDGRVRNLYVYHGARTGRDTSEGAQAANLPSKGPELFKCAKCGTYFGTHRLTCVSCSTFLKPGQKPEEWCVDIVEQVIPMLSHRSYSLLQHLYGDAYGVISGCLRAMYTAGPGMDLICTDYNSIEAVGLAELAGEEWRREVFRTHGKIYEKSAAMMFKVPFEEMMAHRGYTAEELQQPEWWTRDPAAGLGKHHKLRQKGKVAELAFGYQGWIGAAQAFGMPGTDEEIKADILAWREASPAVVEFWGGQQRGRGRYAVPELFGVEGAFIKACQNPYTRVPVMRLDGTHSGVTYECRGRMVFCELPSGRNLHYHNVVLEPSDRGGLAISFEGWNTNPKNGPKGWIRMRTWGGRLVENINQATCRDILRWACIHLEARNYPVVMRTYDEIICEIPKGWGSHEEFEAIAESPPPWAKSWPIRAPDSWRAFRYRKG